MKNTLYQRCFFLYLLFVAFVFLVTFWLYADRTCRILILAIGDYSSKISSLSGDFYLNFKCCLKIFSFTSQIIWNKYPCKDAILQIQSSIFQVNKSHNETNRIGEDPIRYAHVRLDTQFTGTGAYLYPISRQNLDCGPINGSLVFESNGYPIKSNSRIMTSFL
jgi:hypothetical protein